MATIGTYGNPAISSYVIDADGYYVSTNVETTLAEIYETKTPTNQGYLSGFTVTDEGGLNISWTAGTVFDFNNQQIVVVAAGDGACATDLVNYLYWDAGGTLAIGAVHPTGNQVLVAEIYCQSNDIFHVMEMGALDRREHWIVSALDEIFPNIVTNGLTVTEDPNVVNIWDVQMAAGNFFHHARAEHTIAAIVYSRITVMRRWYHAAGAWTSDTNAEIDITQYDNGANLVGVAAAKYHRSVFFTDGMIIHWVYPQAEYATVAAAIDAPDPTLPPGLQNLPKLTAVIIQTGDAAFPAVGSDQWVDVRPMIGQAIGAPISDHGGLSGLADDDHLQYLLIDGTRAMTGNLTFVGAQTVDGVDISAISLSNMPAAATGNIDCGAQAITNVGNVDGVDVSAIVAFTTITGITNDVVADALTDTLTLSSANAILTIVGTAATDTITFTIVEAQISHDNIGGVSADDHHAQVHTHDTDTLQLDGINSDGGAFNFLTTGAITFNNALDGITTISTGGTYFTVDASGNVMLSVANATAGVTMQDSATLELKGKYWTGAATADAAMLIGVDVTVTTPEYEFFIKREDLTKVFSVDEAGNGMVLGDFTVANLITAGNVDGVDVSALKTDVDGFPDELKNLVTAEIQQLENIGAETISAAQWGYLGALDQGLTQASSPTFVGLTLSGAIATPTTITTSGDITCGGHLLLPIDKGIGLDGTAGSATYQINRDAAGTAGIWLESTDSTSQIILVGVGDAGVFFREGAVTRGTVFYDVSRNQTRFYSYGANAEVALTDGGGVVIVGEVDMTGVNAAIDLNPAGTGSATIIDITPSASLVAGSTWRGINMELTALDPATGANCAINGIRINAAACVSVDKDISLYGYLYYGSASESSIGYYVGMGEISEAGKIHTCFYGYLASVLSFTATYQGLYLNWSATTRDANAPVLRGIRIDLPATYADYGASYAGYFSGDGRTVTICDTTYALSVSGAMNLVGAVTGVTTLNTTGDTTIGGDITVNGNDLKTAGNMQLQGNNAHVLIGSTSGTMYVHIDSAAAYPVVDKGAGTNMDLGRSGTERWDEAYGDNWNNEACLYARWHTFEDALSILRPMKGFPLENGDPFRLDPNTVHCSLRPRIKVMGKGEGWTTGYEIKTDKEKSFGKKRKLIKDAHTSYDKLAAREAFLEGIEKDDKTPGNSHLTKKDWLDAYTYINKDLSKNPPERDIPVGNFSDGYVDDDFERSGGISINRLLVVAIQAIQQLEQKVIEQGVMIQELQTQN